MQQDCPSMGAHPEAPQIAGASTANSDWMSCVEPLLWNELAELFKEVDYVGSEAAQTPFMEGSKEKSPFRSIILLLLEENCGQFLS